MALGELSYDSQENEHPDTDRFEPQGVIAALLQELGQIADIAEGSHSVNSLPHIARLARAAITRANITNADGR